MEPDVRTPRSSNGLVSAPSQELASQRYRAARLAGDGIPEPRRSHCRSPATRTAATSRSGVRGAVATYPARRPRAMTGLIGSSRRRSIEANTSASTGSAFDARRSRSSTSACSASAASSQPSSGRELATSATPAATPALSFEGEVVFDVGGERPGAISTHRSTNATSCGLEQPDRPGPADRSSSTTRRPSCPLVFERLRSTASGTSSSTARPAHLRVGGRGRAAGLAVHRSSCASSAARSQSIGKGDGEHPLPDVLLVDHP